MKTFIKKNWLRAVIYGGMACCLVDGLLIEPHWLKVDRLTFSNRPSLRIVHISDLHYKGNRRYLARIVAEINKLHADAVCFTGDIVENTEYLGDALDALAGIQAPLYGVPGNHEYWSGASFEKIAECCEKTGGAWLADRTVVAVGGKLVIVGKSGSDITTRSVASEFVMQGRKVDWPVPQTGGARSSGSVSDAVASLRQSAVASAPSVARKRVLLAHYPAVVDDIKGETYDVILAGHAHGGQVRLPFIGALLVPFGVNGYQMGTYSTPAGPLHVSAGLGTFFLPVRFYCRPEITLIEI